MQAGEQMACGDEAAEQAGAINVAAEDADASAAGHAAAVPVVARGGVELRREEEIEGLDVGRRALGCQEADDILVARQVAEGRELEAVQRDVVRVEIDDVDLARAGRQVSQHVAAAGADGDDPMLWAKLHRLHVDDRILPDLRVDEPREEQAEETFREAGEGEGLVLEQRVFQLRIFSAKANIGG